MKTFLHFSFYIHLFPYLNAYAPQPPLIGERRLGGEGETRQALVRITAASLPVTVVYALSWFGIFTFVNGYLVKELHYSDKEWTAFTLWYTGSMVVWPFFCSELSSRLGRRWAVLCALILAGILFLGFSRFDNRVVICTMLALMALSVVIVSSVFLPMVAEAGGDKPGRALVTFNFVNNLIGATALITGGYLLDYFTYLQTFRFCALACGISAVLFFLLTVNFGGAKKAAKVVSVRNLSRADVLALFTGPYLIIVLCGLSMEAFNYHTVNQLWPNLARTTFGMPTAARRKRPAKQRRSKRPPEGQSISKIRDYGYNG